MVGATTRGALPIPVPGRGVRWRYWLVTTQRLGMPRRWSARRFEPIVIVHFRALTRFIEGPLQPRAVDWCRCRDLVYHGLAGHLLLPGISHVLRVRVTADPDYRVKTARQQQELGPAEALAYIEKVDRERRQWVRFLFGVEWDDPHLHDVVVNLSRIGAGTACETVARLAEQDEFQATAASREAMHNLALASRVRARLAIDSRTRDVELEVVAEGGTVTISGQTQSPAVDKAIETVACAVDGVMEVRSKVVVVPVYPGT